MKVRTRHLWFKAREYGWGWYPVTWQGWCITLFFTLAYGASLLGFIGWLGASQEAGPRVTEQSRVLGITEFVLWIVALTYILFRICYRFGESPTWRWGKKR
jgi:hypothetical protein